MGMLLDAAVQLASAVGCCAGHFCMDVKQGFTSVVVLLCLLIRVRGVCGKG